MSVVGAASKHEVAPLLTHLLDYLAILLRRESDRIAYRIEGSVREDCGNYQISCHPLILPGPLLTAAYRLTTAP